MMRVVLFVGPTLGQADPGHADIDWAVQGPAACGDVYRASQTRPSAIVLVDGVFDQSLAVWHKEILWAMSKGILVYGASSMGALRAAELAPFGMRGVGRIFEWYRDGILEDDDEVAVAHEAGERGYVVRSAAMANVRATLAAAEAHDVIRAETGTIVKKAAKDLFYADRTFKAILTAARGERADGRELESLERWVVENYVDQKRLDALELLTCVRNELVTGIKPADPFHFEYTEAWHELRRRLESR